MRQSINIFSQHSNQFGTLSETVHGTWQDSVGDTFYRDIIQPMKEESSKISTAMEDLTSALYRIKEDIDKI